MLWRSAAGLAAGILLSSAFAAVKPPCEPSAECALRMVREMTMRNAARAQDGDSLRHWLRMAEWLEKVDSQSDAVAAHARFVNLQKLSSKLRGDDDRPLTQQWLASAMVEAELFAEAEKLASSLPVENRDRVYRDLTIAFSGRGNWRDAIRIANLIADREVERATAFHAALKGVARSGKPELVKEAAALFTEPLPVFIPAGVALAEVNAGNEAAALTLAKEQTELGWTVYMLDLIAEKYRDEKRDLDALRIDRMILERAQVEAPKTWLEREGKWYVERSIKAGQYRQALDWWPNLSEKDRAQYLDSAIYGLRNPDDIATAAKLVSGLSGNDRRDAEKALVWARSMAGQVDPAIAIKELARPEAAAQHFIELLVGEENLDIARGRAILAASLAVRKPSVSELFGSSIEAQAQIKVGLLDDARDTARSYQASRHRAEALLLVSAALAKAGRAAEAEETKAEAFKLLPGIDDPRQTDGRAQMLLKTGFVDEAETELRRLMEKAGLLTPAFSRVAEPLLKIRVERGEIRQAFSLAADWSALFEGDAEALATLYSLVQKTESPPPDFSRYLRQMREAGVTRD